MTDRLPTLLPCPWCGSGDLDIGKSKMFGGLMIECEGCQMVVLPPTVSRGEAIAAWNRRAAIVPDPEDGRQVDAVTRVLYEMDKENWVEPDYSQHESYLQDWARRVLTTLRKMK